LLPLIRLTNHRERMLQVLRARRTILSPLTAGIFVLGLLLAGAEGAHAAEPVQPEDIHGHHHEADAGHAADHSDPAAHTSHGHDGHAGHDCEVCLCYAAAGTCSVPAPSAQISPPADAATILRRGLIAPSTIPGNSPPGDIFHPPQS
jgi:hypothetical protein